MKLASLKSTSSRDGELCVVNQELTQAIRVSKIAPTLQYALEHWDLVEKDLQKIYQQLNEGQLDNTFLSIRSNVLLPCPEPINGQMAALTSIMLNWCAKPVVQNFLQTFGVIHSCIREVLIPF